MVRGSQPAVSSAKISASWQGALLHASVLCSIPAMPQNFSVMRGVAGGSWAGKEADACWQSTGLRICLTVLKDAPSAHALLSSGLVQ